MGFNSFMLYTRWRGFCRSCYPQSATSTPSSLRVSSTKSSFFLYFALSTRACVDGLCLSTRELRNSYPCHVWYLSVKICIGARGHIATFKDVSSGETTGDPSPSVSRSRYAVSRYLGVVSLFQVTFSTSDFWGSFLFVWIWILDLWNIIVGYLDYLVLCTYISLCI